MMMMVLALVRYALFGLFIYLTGKLFGKILTEYIFNPALYRTPEQSVKPAQVIASVYQKKAS